jgi:cbb3-type cytochrome c oxidase subunit III
VPEANASRNRLSRIVVIFFVLIITALLVLLIIAFFKEDTPGTKPATGRLQAGEDYFHRVCAQCHGRYGEGGKGPSLVDSVWLHGRARDSIINVITKGVPGKEMASFERALSREEIARLADYVMSLHDQFVARQRGDTTGNEKGDSAVMR